MPIKIKTIGEFKKTRRFLKRSQDVRTMRNLAEYGQRGADGLAAATPVRSGETASSWGYEASYANGSAKLSWTNSNVNDGFNVAELIQYGHGTGTGGWVEGQDYINPVVQPIMNEIADKLWNEVTKD